MKKLFTTIVSAFVLGGAPFALGEGYDDLSTINPQQFDIGNIAFDDINSNAFMDLNNLDFYNYDFINLNLDDYWKTLGIGDFYGFDFANLNLDDYLKTFDFSNYDFDSFNLDDSHFSNQVYTGVNFENSYDSNSLSNSNALVVYSPMNSNNTSGSNLSDVSSALVPYSTMNSGKRSSKIVDNPSVESEEAVYSCTPGYHSRNELDKEWLEKNIPDGIREQGCINYKDSYAQFSQIQTVNDWTYKASRVAETLHVEGDTQYVVTSKSIGFEYDGGTNLGCVALKVADNYGNIRRYDLSEYNDLDDYDWQTKMNEIAASIGAMPLFDKGNSFVYNTHTEELERGRTVNFVKRSAYVPGFSKNLQDYLREGAVL